MIYLLDTHLVLWWVLDSSELPGKARDLLSDHTNNFLVSPVSFWEIAIKRSLGKLTFKGNYSDILKAGPFQSLTLNAEQAWMAGDLPLHHKDPFDRLLVAQAQHEGLTLLTHDRRLKAYGTHIKWV